jgi:crotonobetainyl-CoA:carnitine CoA-transferase CaiB-like acyl-CoA transferase
VNHTNDSGPGLLAGVKIVSFTQFLLGPAAVQYLADTGADVIQIELPGGNMERAGPARRRSSAGRAPSTCSRTATCAR